MSAIDIELTNHPLCSKRYGSEEFVVILLLRFLFHDVVVVVDVLSPPS